MTVVDSPTLTLEPLSPTIGAEVSGIDLREPLSERQVDELRAALLAWKVLFFRDQDITTEQHLRFGRCFGDLEVHPFAPEKQDNPEVLMLTHHDDAPGRENVWHSDVTWRLAPSLGSILRMTQSPPVGGDTLFADMYAAYEMLPDDIKDEIDGKVAVHDFPGFRQGLRNRGASEAEIEAYKERFPTPRHPVVRTHPETGRRALYVNGAFTSHIEGVAPERSDELLQILYRQATFPEYQCRFRWAPNSIAFWDNRACQHYAVSDYFPNVRTAERVTIIGDVPFFDPDAEPTGETATPFRGAIRKMAGR